MKRWVGYDLTGYSILAGEKKKKNPDRIFHN